MLILFFAFGLAFTTDTVYDNNWALVVGINIYQNAPDLSYAVEDALAIKNMLINQHGFPRKNVRYLIDQDATQSNIKKQLSNITKAAGENDRVVFYFAGHGETQPLGLEEGDVGFLLPFDGDADDLYFSAIDMGELTRISNYSKAKHMLFLVDACYGGLAAMNTRSIKTNTPNYLDKVIQENARQIITAGGKDEEVLEKDDWKHSAFTKNILSGLEEKKADSDEDGFITGSELGSYLQRTVSIDTDNFQTPQVKRLTTHGGEIIFH
ncbi:MAG: caspase family protein, partial [Candidatus Marinimicrobia bacterium]|nr:caspase family protein [Candidatus Neomarinimicrobiota bacterium]